MTPIKPRDGRPARHAATRAAILEQAWSLARARSLTGWSLRDLARTVDMSAPSLYVYFDSKNALYDAMFAQGYLALLARIDATPRHPSPAETLHTAAHMYFDFCVEDAARFQLLFQRTIPGFVPSPTTFDHAASVLTQLVDLLRSAGITDPRSVDTYTAVVTGLASQQISNDPGGNRWQSLIDDCVDMFLTRATTRTVNK